MPKTISGLIGRYEIQRPLGGGGMGVLYLAHDPVIERPVAIKLLRDGFDSADVRERFAREARSAGRLHHPNIITIFDVGDHEGQPFIAMEYIHGETLADLILRHATVSLFQKLHWMEDLCAGLQYAHRAGIIHRDVKPANVMISEEGLLKLLDFGIARLGSSAMTQGGIIGTLNYMAPEQIDGQPLDARADIFSLGALFYELLSHHRAFPGDFSDGILTKILSKRPLPLDEVVAGLDTQLVDVVNRCLEKQPADRYPDCASLAREIATARLRLQHQDAGGPEPAVRFAAEEPTGKVDTKRARQRLELMRIRSQQIRTHLQRAREAMDRSAYEDACRDCDQALVLDPEHADALELADRARTALERELIARWVATGYDELGRGAVTAASLLVDRALSLDSSSPDAGALRRAVDEARQQFAEAQERGRRVADALAAAEHELGAGTVEQAAALVADALSIDSTNEAALALRARVVAEVDLKRRAEEEARAAAAIHRARQVFATGRHAEAIEQLTGFRPAQDLVTRAVAELQLEAREIARRAEAMRLETARQRRAEAERQEADQRRVEASADRRGVLEETKPFLTAGKHLPTGDLPTTALPPAPERRPARPPDLERPVRSAHGDVSPARMRSTRWAVLAVAATLVAAGGTVMFRRGTQPSNEPVLSPSADPRAPVPSTSPASPAPSPVTPAPAPSDAPAPAASGVSIAGPPARGSAPAASATAILVPDKDLNDARGALDRKRYGLAVRTYQRLAVQFPDDPRVRDLELSARNLDARQSQKAKDLIRQADQALAVREYDQAIRLYQAALDEYPDVEEATTKLNQTKAAKTRAESVAAEILGRSPGPSKAALSDDQRAKLFAQADALVGARLFDAAIATFDQILAAEPNNDNAKQGRARALGLKTQK